MPKHSRALRMPFYNKNNKQKNMFKLITFPTFDFGFYLSYPLCKLLFEV